MKTRLMSTYQYHRPQTPADTSHDNYVIKAVGRLLCRLNTLKHGLFYWNNNTTSGFKLVLTQCWISTHDTDDTYVLRLALVVMSRPIKLPILSSLTCEACGLAPFRSNKPTFLKFLGLALNWKHTKDHNWHRHILKFLGLTLKWKDPNTTDTDASYGCQHHMSRFFALTEILRKNEMKEYWS